MDFYRWGAIETCLQIRVAHGLTLRETEGFVESLFALFAFRTFRFSHFSLFALLGLEELPVPDYTTLSKRQGDLDIDLPTSSKSSPMHLVLDSTGLKVYGEGEWKQRIHGKQSTENKSGALGGNSTSASITSASIATRGK